MHYDTDTKETKYFSVDVSYFMIKKSSESFPVCLRINVMHYTNQDYSSSSFFSRK